MGEKTDDAKGRVKEAAGDLTGNKDLEREGKLDQAGSAVKDKIEQAGDKLAGAVDAATEKIHQQSDRNSR